ncbi:MAG: hypothetical protein HN396_04455 [Gemmatimonadales bacterium]|jgi:hypothetical protein|nr:hypothetical protein [Gemmatimonadales bacterium]
MSTWQWRVAKALNDRYDYGARFVKTHEAPPGLGRMAYVGEDRVLYSHRNLRDVAASLYESSGLRGTDLRERIAYLRTVRDTMLSLRHGDNMLVLPYEQMFHNPMASVCAIVWLMWEEGNHPVSTKAVMEIVDECDVTAARQVMDKLAQSHPGVPWGQEQFSVCDPDTNIHLNHVSIYGGEDDHWRERLHRDDLGWVGELEDVLPD